MSNEIIWTYASQIALESAGASLASNGFQLADTADLTWRSAITRYFPWVDFVLCCDFTAAVNGTSYVNLYRQELDIDGLNDAPAATTGYTYKFVGSFAIQSGVGGASSPQYYPLNDVEIKLDQQYIIENKSDKTLEQFWTLKATPKTYEPAT